jgi:hypothetical protein
MSGFLEAIGWYNVAGSFVLMAMMVPSIADRVLRRYSEVGSAPYESGPYGALWLWWAATTNLFLGFVMVRAVHWAQDAQRDVSLGAFGVYFLMELALIIAHIRRRIPLGRGVWVVHVMWWAQLGWAAVAIVEAV